MSASLSIDPLAAYDATVNFNIAMLGGAGAAGYIGVNNQTPNRAQLTYDALTSGDVSIGWSFDYLGPNPFGLQILQVFENGAQILSLGDFGQIGHHEDSHKVAIQAGNTYVFQLLFVPNVRSGLDGINGRLLGSMSFAFPQPCDSPTILGTNGSDVLLGTDGPDIIAGLGGDDLILGNGGNDIICGGDGNDVLIGGAGDDLIFGGAGNDNISGDAGNDVIDGGDGLDNISGGAGDDSLDGGAGSDNLVGDQGRDSAIGGPGADSCSAESRAECER
jgi:Ca2+-binding RTX toxin-like protein